MTDNGMVGDGGSDDDASDDGGIEPNSWHEGGVASDPVGHGGSGQGWSDDDRTESDRLDEHGDDGAGEPDLIDLIGQGRFVAASKLAARRLGVAGPARSGRLGVRHLLVRAANAVGRQYRLLQLGAAVAASVAAIATLYLIFGVEILVEGEVPGTPQTVTVWSLARQAAPVGSYGLVLRVLVPIVLAVALMADRWWRPALVVATVSSVQWMGRIADIRRQHAELQVEVATDTWEVIGLAALAMALVLGCLLVVTGLPEVGGRSPGRAEVASAVTGLVFLALAWGKPQMVFAAEGEQVELTGVLQGWTLLDLGGVTQYPFDYAVRYLPVLLLALAVAAMFTRPGRGRPGVRCGVWLGLAAGAMADVGLRLPLWHEPEPGYFWNAGATGTWSPGLAAFALLIGSAVAAVTAAWLAWQQIETTSLSPALDEPPEVSTVAT